MKKNKKGFTLAELLIVVAIIAVLVAISIPIFTAQLKKARLATNKANARAALSAAMAEFIDAPEKDKELRVNKLSNILRFHLPFRIMGA
jgi:prepilin-type N-terminal cleavage/methylation domain-containing protein